MICRLAKLCRMITMQVQAVYTEDAGAGCSRDIKKGLPLYSKEWFLCPAVQNCNVAQGVSLK